MTGANKSEVSATGFSPHIEELHEFFRSRGVAFGKPEDLTRFAERLSKDESFRAEMASMVRAIIYRERDGLTPVELMQLLVTAVGGGAAEDSTEEVRDSVRQIMGFASGVFRSRWNPGGSVAANENDAEVDAAVADAPQPAPADAPSRPMTPIFYQAQVVAKGGGEPGAENATNVAKKLETVETHEVVLPLRGTSDAADGPTLTLAGYASQPEPVVAFLRGEGAREEEPLHEVERRRSNGWGWAAAILAIVIAFCAGMFTRQRMIARYGPAWPWHLPATWAAGHRATPAAAATPAVTPSSGAPAGAPIGTAAQPRKPAQVEAARSTWNGGTESAMDLGQPAAGVPTSGASPAGAAPGRHGAAGATGGLTGVSTPPSSTSATEPSPEDEAKALRSARVTAMVGASPALMESHLEFAPEPAYPNAAKNAHVQGSVLVEALVGRDGSVVSAHAISGNRMLRGAAEEAVSERRYKPYVVDGIPMAVRTLVTIDFRLK